MADEKRDIYERTLALGQSGKFKGVRTDGKVIEVKPRAPGKQEWRPLSDREPEPPRAA